MGFDQEPLQEPSRDQFIDLHIHSTASDGSLSPFEIVAASAEAGLAAISITDHDSIDGCRQLIESPRPLPLNFLTGVEISSAMPADFSLSGSLHILGYDVDINNDRLRRSLAEQQAARNHRSPKIIERLNDLGISLSLEDVYPFARGNQIGRPHIARAMVKLGVVTTIEEAFDLYIGRQGPAYVDKARIPCDQAMELLREAGGVPVLAHPGLIPTRNADELEALINLLKKMGLKGLEVFYPDHSAEQVEACQELAARYHLLLTGGSDFHGALNPQIKLGRGTGDLFVSYTLYEGLLAHNRGTMSPGPDIKS